MGLNSRSDVYLTHRMSVTASSSSLQCVQIIQYVWMLHQSFLKPFLLVPQSRHFWIIVNSFIDRPFSNISMVCKDCIPKHSAFTTPPLIITTVWEPLNYITYVALTSIRCLRDQMCPH